MKSMKPMVGMSPMAPMKPMEPMKPQARWWPEELGEPDSAGSQNELKYAYFSGPQRLAVQNKGKLTLYDTAHHRIGGVAQQQHDDAGGATFTSQEGQVSLDELSVIGR